MRLQVYPGVYRNGFHCFRNLVAEEGALALFKGVIPPMAAQVKDLKLNILKVIFYKN